MEEGTVPKGPPTTYSGGRVDVHVDNVWATPSGLHMRVTVWGPDHKWRHKYECMVPVAEIQAEAIEPLWEAIKDEAWSEDLSDIPLF